MSTCSINRGLNTLPCLNSIAGIARVYLANWDDYDILTESNPSGHTITDLGDLSTVFKYEVKNDGNSFTETSTKDRNNGTTVFDQSVVAVMNKLTKEKQHQLQLMAWGLLLVFVEFANGDVVCVGLRNGAEATFESLVEGSLAGAFNTTITFTGQEREAAFFLTDGMIMALKELISEDTMDA
jgi:hypothetical protein